MAIKTLFFRSIVGLILISLGLFAVAWLITFHPPAVQTENISCPTDSPRLSNKQTIRLYNHNVQFMAGKNYVFFYDMANNAGPDERPAAADIQQTLQGLAQLITQQNPDIILLQEVDHGAKRTDYADQLSDLLELLPEDYRCHTSSVYWQASYLPHPRIMGAVGTKLSIISKYKIHTAKRHQLSLIPEDPISQLFNFKRALLDARLPLEEGGELAVLTTHLSAFSKGTDTLQRQVTQIDQHLQQLDKEKTAWIIGGDFNLLPPNSYPLLAEAQRVNYQPDSAIDVLYQRYAAIPSLQATQSAQRSAWFTYYSNDPSVKRSDRTIDYYFYSRRLSLKHAFIEREGAPRLSDHLPIIADITIQ